MKTVFGALKSPGSHLRDARSAVTAEVNRRLSTYAEAERKITEQFFKVLEEAAKKK